MTTDSSFLTPDDLYLFNEGTHYRLYDKLGARVADGGVRFGVWAPNAEAVSVVGDFNGWNAGANPLSPRGESGIWEGTVPGIGAGVLYKFHIRSRFGGYQVDKADPMALRSECPPKTASVVHEMTHQWGDATWMGERGRRIAHRQPVSIYELHLGSWRHPDGHAPNYRAIASHLADHVDQLGFTHVELLPIQEHPFYGSWGYQVTGYFSPTARYGTPEDLMFMIDHLHQRGIGVILDWVPAHFPTDEHGLAFFDGTYLYEHADPRKGFHPDWTTAIYNYGRSEVKSFLISSAIFWLDRYHVDALRIDGVASMLYLDYSREPGEWIPNPDGSNENHEAVAFLRRLNEAVYATVPGVQTIAEESTAWPGVSRPTSAGGLGFGYKWDLGWMHDTLVYLTRDPVHRSHHHDELTFRAIYQYHENYVLPLSHDEVVHGKGSLLSNMPGDKWQKLANLRLLYGYQYALPGKKLLFMGSELAPWDEWHHDAELDWGLEHAFGRDGLAAWLRDLNRTYRAEPALHEGDNESFGFEWIDLGDRESSVLSFLRWDQARQAPVAVVCNFTPVPRERHRIGLPVEGTWREILNSDAGIYGGSQRGNLGAVVTDGEPWHGRPTSAVLHLPPLACVMLRYEPNS